MKRIVYIVIVALICGAAYIYFRNPPGAKVIINGYTINVEVAVTESSKEKGLGERKSLAPGTGMLFVYQNKDRYGFWMKGMRFPLDFIWIDGNVVVDLSPDIPALANPGDTPVTLSPKVPVDKVLEVGNGVIERLDIKVGDIVQFSD